MKIGNMTCFARAVFTLALFAGVMVFVTEEAQGQIKPQFTLPPVPLYPWGNSNAVIEYCVTNSQVLGVDVYSGQTNEASTRPSMNNLTSKSQVDAFFRSWLIAAAQTVTTNVVVDKTKPLSIYATTIGWDPVYPQIYAYFMIPAAQAQFSLIYSNGAYVLPDFSGISLVPEQQLPFHVAGLKWAQIVVYSATDLTMPISVQDSRTNGDSFDSGIFPSIEAVYVGTSYISAGTNTYRMRMSTQGANGMQIVNGNGELITPLSLTNFTYVSNVVKFFVNGGEPGMTFVIQKSTDMKTWTQTGGTQSVGNSPVSYQETVPANSKTGFYRTAIQY